MSAPEPAAVPDRSEERTPSMRDLLASCAAADAVSKPPAPQPPEPAEDDPAPERGSAERRSTAHRAA
ncbi:hypothetical protein [Streptomyces orinoci]|uniref:Uncharacterized protein n=1 Tax=Streptomyces orinoci TaxID=67339 RepID=A0ABV3JZ39_STRON|nr:hypothetical protein [Streptomyces orinoci]